jgi:hypothetical protein
MEAACPLDQDEVEALLTSCKYGMSLEEISDVLSVEVGTVASVLAETTGITAKTLKMIYKLRELDKTLDIISDICKVPMSSLTMISASEQSSHLSIQTLKPVEVSLLGQPEVQAAGIVTAPEQKRQAEASKAAAEATHKPSPHAQVDSPLPGTVVDKSQVHDTKLRRTKRRRNERLTWPNRDVYEGQVLNDLPHGKGTMKMYAQRSTYVGDWVHGVRQGRGTLTSQREQECYEGQFANNEFHGRGTKWYRDGPQYSGTWKHSRRQGFGVYNYIDGGVYVGWYYSDIKMGCGTLNTPDGIKYSGQFKNNRKVGFAKQTWPDGEAYEGFLKEGVRHGFGKYTSADGRVYAGSWKDGLKHGYGVFTWPNGDTFEGLFNQSTVVTGKITRAAQKERIS